MCPFSQVIIILFCHSLACGLTAFVCILKWNVNFVCFWILYKWHNVCLLLWLSFFNLIFLRLIDFYFCNLSILLMDIWVSYVFVFTVANSAAIWTSSKGDTAWSCDLSFFIFTKCFQIISKVPVPIYTFISTVFHCYPCFIFPTIINFRL